MVGIDISNANAESLRRSIDEAFDGGYRRNEDRDPCKGLQNMEAMVQDNPEIELNCFSGGC